MNDIDILKLFKETGALLEGHFKLRSGLHSDQFFQCALLLQYPEISSRLCEVLVNKLNQRINLDDIDVIISPAIGGITLGHDVARITGKKYIFVEKEEGFLKLRRFKIDAGERFLIIEDVITKGGRVKETIDIVHNFEGKVNGIGVLVDRSNQNIDFNAPLVSLLNISPNVYDPKNLPEWLAKIPLSQPGSK
jgi:orotate phosphoribosyltransferase